MTHILLILPSNLLIFFTFIEKDFLPQRVPVAIERQDKLPNWRSGLGNILPTASRIASTKADTPSSGMLCVPVRSLTKEVANPVIRDGRC